MTCLLSAIHTRVRSTFTIYFSATEDTDIEKKKKREESEDDTPTKKLPYPKQIFFIISMEACERFSYYGMNSKDIKNYLRTFNEVNLSAILTIYLIHLFERIYSREVGRVAIFSFQSSLLSREQRMSAPPSTTSTSSAATPHRSSERPWRTLSSGNTGESLLWPGSWSFNDPF